MVARQAPLFMGFSKQEYWTGLPCPPPGDLPNPGIKPVSSALQADSLLSETSGKPRFRGWVLLNTEAISLEVNILVKAMVFPVVVYGCESWTVKKAEHRKIDAFELWCWTARRSNQSILKEIGPGCSLEGLMLKLKLQYFGHLMRRVDSLEKTLMLGGIWGQEGKGMTEDEMVGWHHRLDGHEFG